MSTTSPAKTLTDLSLGIPIGIASKVILDIIYGASGTESYVEVKSKLTGSITNCCKVEASTSGESLEYRYGQITLYSDTSGNIQYMTTAGTSENLSINLSYYIDNRN